MENKDLIYIILKPINRKGLGRKKTASVLYNTIDQQLNELNKFLKGKDKNELASIKRKIYTSSIINVFNFYLNFTDGIYEQNR